MSLVAEDRGRSRSELEKMLAGEYYDAGDPKLREMRRSSSIHSASYNTGFVEREERYVILSSWLGKIGSRCSITPPFRCDYGRNIEIGENFYANFDCVFLDCARIRFGRDCLLGPGVHVYTAIHPLDPAERLRGLENAQEVTVGDNVWIGGRTVILAGVHIGDGAVIGAGSVVTRSVPAYTLAFGSPARVVRSLVQPADGDVDVQAKRTAAIIEVDGMGVSNSPNEL